MTNNEQLIETLNDLVKINNDRIAGYDRAAEESRSADIDLQAIFEKMAQESRTYKAELNEKIMSLGGSIDNTSTVAGKIYRGWMSVKNLFTGSDRKSILESCEFGEDAAQKAYDEALESDADIDVDTRQLIVKQKNSLKTSHDVVKKYRDLVSAHN